MHSNGETSNRVSGYGVEFLGYVRFRVGFRLDQAWNRLALAMSFVLYSYTSSVSVSYIVKGTRRKGNKLDYVSYHSVKTYFLSLWATARGFVWRSDLAIPRVFLGGPMFAISELSTQFIGR